MTATDRAAEAGRMREPGPWRRWGPYLAERAWGTVREDYSADGGAESTTALFGGNSNWRGPVWFPLNHLVVEALRRLDRFFGDDLTVELPTGSGTRCSLREVADDLSERLVSLFRARPDGRRPASADLPDAWRDRLVFSEYFHGETGAGLGASHQTGWTGLVADLLLRRESTR